MALIAFHKELPALLTVGSIIRAEDLPILNQARALLLVAEQRAQEIHQSLDLIIPEAKKKGRLEGIEDAKQEATEIKMKAMADIAKYMRLMQENFIEILINSMRCIIMDLPPRERFAQLIGKAFSDLGDAHRVALCVHPSEATIVHEAIAMLGGMVPSGGIEVKIRAELSEGSCIFETPIGVIDGSLESQLTAIKASLRLSVEGVG